MKSSLASVALCLMFFGVGCGEFGSTVPPGAFLGRIGVDDYSPTAMQKGSLQQFWWCGEGHNPNRPSQDTDTIQYASIDLSTHTMNGPVTVLGETPGAWDSDFLCNPKVIGGTFHDPLGDGQIYSYALYYVATNSPSGVANSIGVAFSNDGIKWKKYPDPVIVTSTKTNYGVGQPALYNSDQKSGIAMFYEDNNAPPWGKHVEATSTDGIHFSVVGNLTTNGLSPETTRDGWGDMAFDSVTGYWYAVFNDPWRGLSATGGVAERGQRGVELYRIPKDSLLNGTTPWQRLKSFDTNLTGNEANFIAGFLRDQYGNLNVGQYPTIQLYTSISNPKPAWNASPVDIGNSVSVSDWDIGSVTWTPDQQLLPLIRYSNATVHEVTTGWIDPNGGFSQLSVLGHLYEGPFGEATQALYGCKSGSTDYFVSNDITCGGKLLLGLQGYAYAHPVSGVAVVALYSCSTNHDHFVSNDANCEGSGAGTLVGYAVP